MPNTQSEATRGRPSRSNRGPAASLVVGRVGMDRGRLEDDEVDLDMDDVGRHGRQGGRARFLARRRRS